MKGVFFYKEKTYRFLLDGSYDQLSAPDARRSLHNERLSYHTRPLVWTLPSRSVSEYKKSTTLSRLVDNKGHNLPSIPRRALLPPVRSMGRVGLYYPLRRRRIQEMRYYRPRRDIFNLQHDF